MVQPIFSQDGSVVRKCKPRVYVKYLWKDAWKKVDYLYPIQSKRTAFPEMSSATFQWLFGKIYYFGSPPRIAQQLNLRDYYVKIVVEFVNGQTELVWVGIITDDEVT